MKTVVQASDGNIFESADQCAAYEAMLLHREAITTWAKENFGDKQGQSTRVINIVELWETVRSQVLGSSE